MLFLLFIATVVFDTILSKQCIFSELKTPSYIPRDVCFVVAKTEPNVMKVVNRQIDDRREPKSMDKKTRGTVTVTSDDHYVWCGSTVYTPLRFSRHSSSTTSDKVLIKLYISHNRFSCHTRLREPSATWLHSNLVALGSRNCLPRMIVE